MNTRLSDASPHSRVNRAVTPKLPYADRAKGVFIYDEAGNDYLDGSAGPMAVSLGHGVPEILDVMREQAEKICFAYRTQFDSRAKEGLIEALVDLAPEGFDWAFLVNSGSEGTELALRSAIHYWEFKGRPAKVNVLGQSISYHGMTMGSLSMSGHASRRKDYSSLLHEFALGVTPYSFRAKQQSQAEYLREVLDNWERVLAEKADIIAGIIVEPVVGAAGGALTPPDGYLSGLRALCDKYEVLLIADEVITGLGRTGTWFGCEHDGVVPDMIVTAKGMSSGFTPMGAVLYHHRVSESFRDVQPQGHTFSGNPLSSAVCLAVVRYMRSTRILENVRARGEQLKAGLERLSQAYPWMADVRGRGLLWGFELLADPEKHTPPAAEVQANRKFVDHCFAEKLIVYPAGVAPYNNAIIISPPLTITEQEVEVLLTRLEAGMRGYSKELGPRGS
ncbi:aminotransferase class III-fold pyridoxal phosphate-dependent enzyme [Castellaniella sp. GW247-6E4]|uniref:aminotransferase family protein n=1 Tax=Castellaniella sp. GW247-6E4 TaxID=3140380 RepID=UPI003315E0A1